MIMKDMKKDEFLEEKLNSYVEGSEEPKVDLSAAKRALGEEQTRQRGVRRRMWVALASACACLLLVAIVLVSVLPSLHADQNGSAEDMMNGGSAQGGDVGGDPGPSGGSSAPGSSGDGGSSGSAGDATIVYALSETEATTVEAEKLVVNYGTSLKKLTDLAASQEISVLYTIHSLGDAAVLLETTVSAPAGAKIIVYTDLTDGRYRAAKMEEFDSLSQKTATYVYDFKTLKDETVYLGAFTAGVRYCVTAHLSDVEFFEFMAYLTEE